uniref:Uncharacterized protein LOC114340773 isoform X2 n=1 Tax=Diabrotica virgifera virgifera TaxID=50390 RepID=A0A6P7GD38_DIAVI
MQYKKTPRFCFFFTKSRQDSIPTSTSFQDDPIATVSDILEGSSSRRDDSSTENSDPLCNIELHPEKSSPERQILVEVVLIELICLNQELINLRIDLCWHFYN